MKKTDLRAYALVFALAAIWIFFQWKTVSDIYPYGLFLHPVNFANLLKQMSVSSSQVFTTGIIMVIVGALAGAIGSALAVSRFLDV